MVNFFTFFKDDELCPDIFNEDDYRNIVHNALHFSMHNCINAESINIKKVK